MAQQTIEETFKELFDNRRYCGPCGRMTPVLDHNNPKFSTLSGVSSSPACEICGSIYGLSWSLSKMNVTETYGIAYVNKHATIKLANSIKL